jgi:hypothetical protein
MSFFEQYEANPADLSTAHALLHRMAQKVVRGGGEANQVWIDLLRDMLIIRDQVHLTAMHSSIALITHARYPLRAGLHEHRRRVLLQAILLDPAPHWAYASLFFKAAVGAKLVIDC